MEDHGEADNYRTMIGLIEQSIINQTLVRLSVLKGRGVKLNIPCKILGFDEESLNLTVYHVDDKKVHLIHLNEIDDFIMS